MIIRALEETDLPFVHHLNNEYSIMSYWFEEPYQSLSELENLYKNGQIATQYVDLDGNIAYGMPHNPNASLFGIEGITSKNGQIIGKMGHSERFEDGLFQNIPGNKDQHLFASAVQYFTGK